MGWLEAQKRYQTGDTITRQTVEDLVARRALRGLGLVQRQLPVVERMLYDENYPDEALWVRTERILKRTAQLNGFPQAFDYILCDTTKTHKEPLERLEMFDDSIVRPVILTRLKDTKQSLAYSIWLGDELDEYLEPPYTALKRQGDYLIVLQDTEKFFAQFQWDSVSLGVT